MFEEYLPYIQGIILGAFYGAQASLYTYLATENLPLSWQTILTKRFWETFQWTKFGKTMLVGMVFGALTTAYGFVSPGQWDFFTQITGLPQIPLGLILNFANTGIVIGVDRLTKLVIRRTPLVRAWDKFKEWVFKILTAQAKAKAIIEEAKKEEHQ